MQFCEPLTCIISSGTDSDYDKLVRRKINVPHIAMFIILNTWKNFKISVGIDLIHVKSLSLQYSIRYGHQNGKFIITHILRVTTMLFYVEDGCLLGCSATTQKTAIFILAAVRTSNRNYFIFLKNIISVKIHVCPSIYTSNFRSSHWEVLVTPHLLNQNFRNFCIIDGRYKDDMLFGSMMFIPSFMKPINWFKSH
jgi:hypothetical protein